MATSKKATPEEITETPKATKSAKTTKAAKASASSAKEEKVEIEVQKDEASEVPEVTEAITEATVEEIETEVQKESDVYAEEEAEDMARVMRNMDTGDSQEIADLLVSEGVGNLDDVDTTVEGQVEQSTVETRQPRNEQQSRRITLREAMRSGENLANQRSLATEYTADEIRLESERDRYERAVRSLMESKASGLILEGELTETTFLGNPRDEKLSTNRSELEKRCTAIVKFGDIDVYISYRDFVNDGQPAPSIASISTYCAVMSRAMSACPKITFIVTNISRDRHGALYVGNRRVACNRLAQRAYLGIQPGRRARLDTEIKPNLGYPARITNRVVSGLRLELCGITFFLPNHELTYSGLPEVINRIKNNPSNRVWVYPKSIKEDEKTHMPIVEFTGRDPLMTATEKYIEKKQMLRDDDADEINIEVGGNVSAVRAKTVTFHRYGIYCELLGEEGVKVSCSYTDNPRLVGLDIGETVLIRVARRYRYRNGDPVILGKIIKVATPNPRGVVQF